MKMAAMENRNYGVTICLNFCKLVNDNKCRCFNGKIMSVSKTWFKTLIVVFLFTGVMNGNLSAAIHVFEVVEETFLASETYENPYIDVDLWVTLTGPGGTYKIPAFWDGGKTFRVRLVAIEPGTWTWSTGNKTGDKGLDNKQGSFDAVAWNESEIKDNPNRRGFIRVATDNHTLAYALSSGFRIGGWSGIIHKSNRNN